MAEWQPIETAPHDTEIDVWASYPKSAKGNRVTDAFFDNGRWLDDDRDEIEWGPDAYGQTCVVTHWMPLPEPPK